MSTLNSSPAGYLNGLTLFDYLDVRVVSDLLSDSGKRYSGSPDPDPVTVANSPRLLRLLQSASGELETACLAGTRYSPADLQLLTNLSANVTGVTTGTTNTTVTTSAPLGVILGGNVTLANVGGATQANGTFPITVVGSPTAFNITTSLTGAYTSGGTATLPSLSNGGELVNALVAGLVIGKLYDRRPDKGQPPPIVERAADMLERLRQGEAVLGLLEHQQAGLPSHHVDTPADVFDRGLLVPRSFRYYGRRVNERWGKVNGGGAGYGSGGG